MIKIPISNHPLTGAKRVIVFDGIQYLSYQLQSADLVWFEYYADQDGEPIFDETIPPRRIITAIDNQNKVTEQGILITKEYVESITALDKESETYQEDLEKEYQEALSKGHPEFSFWVTAVGWDDLITGAGNMLEQFKRFDRK